MRFQRFQRQERMLDPWILARSKEQGWIWAPWVDFHGFHQISLICIEFYEFCGFGRFLVRVLWQPVAALRGNVLPLQESFGSLNPSKEQGARLDLSSLVWFSWIPSNFIDFRRISWNSWIWEVSGENAGAALRGHVLPLQERMLDLRILARSKEQGWIWTP